MDTENGVAVAGRGLGGGQNGSSGSGGTHFQF